MATEEKRVTYDDLSAALKRQITALRRPITALAAKFGIVRVSLKETAPKVMQLFDDIKTASRPTPFSFVEFARMFDPGMPTHAADRDGEEGYRNHKVYYTLDYMRRMANLRPAGPRGVRDSATDALARTIATILQVKGVDEDTVWQAVQKEFPNFGERVITGLKKRVERTKPLFELRVSTPARVGNIIHMQPAAAEAAANREAAAAAAATVSPARAAGDLAARGRRVRRSA